MQISHGVKRLVLFWTPDLHVYRDRMTEDFSVIGLRAFELWVFIHNLCHGNLQKRFETSLG